MRILQIAALFTTLLIARGRCRPETANDYQSDADIDYEEETVEPENREEPDANTAPVRINSVPLKLLVKLGDTVTLPCNVPSSQAYLVEWRKGVTPLYSDYMSHLTQSEKKRIVWQTDNSLIIYNFTKDDVSDEYICRTTSEPPDQVVHSVRISRNVFVTPSNVIKVNEPNKDLKLGCQTNWEPKPIVKWFHEGKRVSSDDFPKDGSSLTVRNVSEINSGRYQCLVENGGGSEPTLYPIYVLFPHAPKIEVETEIVHAGMNLESELTCRVDAYPYAMVAWYKNGNKVLVGRQNNTLLENQKTRHSLVFSRTQKSDFGKYSCEATNKIGKSTRIIELTGTPAPAKFVGMTTSADGTVPILEWIVHSNSPIIKYELEYRLVGGDVWSIVSPRASDDGTSNTFKVRHTLEGLKAGKYEAVLLAQNEFGWSPRPREPTVFEGEYINPEPDTGASKSAGTVSLILRSLLLASSLLVCTTYL